jgi:N-acetylglucosamine-6-sulfatase
MLRRLSVLVLLIVCAACTPGSTAVRSIPSTVPTPVSRQPNFLVIVTDDQVPGTERHMPVVRRRIGSRGLRFTRGFTTDPLCCPSRATILTGLYPHTHGVYANGGGASAFEAGGNDARSIGPLLDGAGYRTGVIGKYLNGVRRVTAPGEVPPGWDTFVSFHANNGKYYDYDLTVDGVLEHHGDEPGDYSTDVLGQRAMSFLRADTTEPFFLLFAPYAPHGPFIPAPRHVGDLADLPPRRNPAINEVDVSDKPPYIRRLAPLSGRQLATIRDRGRGRAEALLSVDQAIGSMLDLLRKQGRLHDTMIVFLSDNGLAEGEHRWRYKEVPYEVSIRIPFLLRFDPLTSTRAGEIEDRLVLNADLAPTFLELAGVAPAGAMDGRSLVPLLQGGAAGWRGSFLIEYLRDDRGYRPEVPTYCALRTGRWKYIVYASGYRELYDLENDPSELRNVADDRSGVGRRLHRRLEKLCSPPPPGMTFR